MYSLAPKARVGGTGTHGYRHIGLLCGGTAFASGFIVMSIEVLGFRMLAPHFGYSSQVFGALVGVILLSLSVGYWIGGQWSVHRLSPNRFFGLWLGAGLYLAIVSVAYPALLDRLSDFGLVGGVVAATATMWTLPMVILAATSPFLIGISASQSSAGRASGHLTAVGTLGALVGTFATSFGFLPMLGSKGTLMMNAYAVIAGSAIWLLPRARWLVAAAGLFASLGFVQVTNGLEGVVHAEESAYSYLEVVDDGTVVGLRTDYRSNLAYSVVPKDGSLPAALVYQLFAVPAAGATNGLLLGLGAGTLPLVHELLSPSLRLTGVEIDPRVVAVGRSYLGLSRRTNVDSIIIEDARPYLASRLAEFDLIELDVFRSAEIPFYLVTREFFTLVGDRLSRSGVLAMNLHDPTRDRRVVTRVANTAAAVFREVHIVPAGNGSFLLTAGNLPGRWTRLPAPATQQLSELFGYFIANASRVDFEPGRGLFTDDHAPIEAVYR